MPLIIGKIKCYFCRGKDGVIHSVCDYGLYGDWGRRIFYHPECLEMVEMNPEKFGNTMMDKAINIDDLRKQNIEECNKNLVKEFEKKVATLHRKHFERMMPRKN
jgi:hypothetical protein